MFNYEKRAKNLAIIRCWAMDSTGYESDRLYSMYDDCSNGPNTHEPTPEYARRYASIERYRATNYMYNREDCLAAEATFEALATKLHEIEGAP